MVSLLRCNGYCLLVLIVFGDNDWLNDEAESMQLLIGICQLSHMEVDIYTLRCTRIVITSLCCTLSCHDMCFEETGIRFALTNSKYREKQKNLDKVKRDVWILTL